MAKKDDLDIFGSEGNTQPNPTNSQFGGFGGSNSQDNLGGAFSNIDMGDVKERKPVSKKKIISGILASVVLLVGGTGGFLYLNKTHKHKLAVESAKNIENQRVAVLNKLKDAIPNFNTKELLPEGDDVISNLDMEIVYMNENKVRTEFLKKVLESAEVSASKQGIDYTHINWFMYQQ